MTTNAETLTKVRNYFKSGKTLTVKQAKSFFKVENAYDLIYRLRNEGLAVVTIRKGKSFAYRLENSADHRDFTRNLKKNPIKARASLYKDALGFVAAAA